MKCMCKAKKKDSDAFKAAINKDSIKQLWLKIYEEILISQYNKLENSRDIIMSLSYFESVMMKNDFKSYSWLLKTDESINFFLRWVRGSYLRTKSVPLSQTIAQKMKEMDDPNLLDGIIMVIHLLNPVFDNSSKEVLDTYISKKNTEINLLGLDYGIEFILTSIGPIFLIKHFVRKLEDELFMTRETLASPQKTR